MLAFVHKKGGLDRFGLVDDNKRPACDFLPALLIKGLTHG